MDEKAMNRWMDEKEINGWINGWICEIVNGWNVGMGGWMNGWKKK